MECLLIFIVPSLQNICSHTAYTHVNTVAQMTGAVVWTEHLVHAYIYIGVGGENVNVKPFLLLAVCHPPPHTLHFPTISLHLCPFLCPVLFSASTKCQWLSTAVFCYGCRVWRVSGLIFFFLNIRNEFCIDMCYSFVFRVHSGGGVKRACVSLGLFEIKL